MLNDSVYKDLSARCGGRARIGVAGAGEGACAPFNAAAAAAFGVGGCPLSFCGGAEDCCAVIAAGAENAALPEKIKLPCVAIDGTEEVTPSSLEKILRALLFKFPVAAIDVVIPSWVRSLPAQSSAVAELLERVRDCASKINCLEDCSLLDGLLADSKNWRGDVEVDLSPADGRATVRAQIKEGAFFDMLSETAGEAITDESSLMAFVVSAAEASKNYGKVKDALECARVTGYGIVQPSDDDLSLEKPTVVRQGGSVGVKLKANAPSYHIIKIDVSGEVSPIMGAASQSEGMVGEIMNGFENDPAAMWNTNLFGKSLRGMVQEGLAGKVNCMQDDTRAKMRKAITRIVNEGKGGVICILL